MSDEKFLVAYDAWLSWQTLGGHLPPVGGAELAEIQLTRNQQVRFSKDEKDLWFCSDFAPGMVDFAGFSLAGQTMDADQAFAKIHIDNCDLAISAKKPVYTIFKAIKAVNVALWQVLYLPVHSCDIEQDEVIAILQPIVYRKTYLEDILNALPHGLMTVMSHAQDGKRDLQFQVIECNRPMAEMMRHKMLDVIGMDLPTLWPEANQEALEKVMIDVLQDGNPRNFNAHYSQEGERRNCESRITKSSWGLTVYTWDTGKAD
ncbi:MAG: PAS domain-containing protein [Cohaesibacter sp.]|nr:PAS domain-containing protein [Cohaesibacter sp.]